MRSLSKNAAMRALTVPAALAALCCAPLGCSSSSTTPSGGTTVTTDASSDLGSKTDTTTVAVTPVINLTVDSSRDGVAKAGDKDDEDFETVFDATHGASFLPNLDDDDSNRIEDFYDETIPNDKAAEDLAPLLVQAWKDVPEGATAKLTVEPSDKARIWAKFSDGTWGWLAGAQGVCDGSAECNGVGEVAFPIDLLKSGAELGLEGRQFRMSASTKDTDPLFWDGQVTVTLTVYDKNGLPYSTAAGTDKGTDKVVLRVAPWLQNGNLSEFDNFKSMSFSGKGNSAAFNTDLVAAKKAIGDKVSYDTYTYYIDRWTQDWYQTGTVQIPGPGGTVRGARVYNARPFANNGAPKMPIVVLKDKFLGPDKIALKVYWKDNSGSSFDSHGNHDLLPGYTNGTASYPLGRILTGSGILPETMDFYAAQRVQAPVVVVNTTWLAVGHCDEILSYVPAKTPRGWKLLYGNDKMAIEMFTQLQKDGNGAVELFAGRTVYRGDAQMKTQPTIDTVMADADLIQSSQAAHVKTDAAVELVKGELGLTEDELVPIPFLTEDLSTNEMIAWQPGTVNSLVMYDHIMVPNTYGPIVGGADVFAKDLQDRLGTDKLGLGSDGKGMKVHLIDDWYGYHLNMGEVHCGTNPEQPPSAKLAWWKIVH